MRKTQMNDKLRQFEKESKLEIFGLGARRDKWEKALEKYAELIVKECLQVINQPNGVGDDDVIRISDDVKQHFGVEL